MISLVYVKKNYIANQILHILILDNKYHKLLLLNYLYSKYKNVLYINYLK